MPFFYRIWKISEDKDGNLHWDSSIENDISTIAILDIIEIFVHDLIILNHDSLLKDLKQLDKEDLNKFIDDFREKINDQVKKAILKLIEGKYKHITKFTDIEHKNDMFG